MSKHDPNVALRQMLVNGIGAGTTELHIFRPIADTVFPAYALAFFQSSRFIENGVAKFTGTAGQNIAFFSFLHFLKSLNQFFVKLMQDAGAIRQDIDAKVIAHIMDILAFGLVGMDELVAREDMPPLADLIEGIAAIMDKALTPDDGGNPEAGKAIIRQISEATRHQFEQMRQSKQG